MGACICFVSRVLFLFLSLFLPFIVAKNNIIFTGTYTGQFHPGRVVTRDRMMELPGFVLSKVVTPITDRSFQSFQRSSLLSYHIPGKRKTTFLSPTNSIFKRTLTHHHFKTSSSLVTFSALSSFSSSINPESLKLSISTIPFEIIQDSLGGMTVVGGAALWLYVCTLLGSKWKIPSNITRKIIHCGSAPLFLACWPFFSDTPNARYFAAVAPLLQMVALFYKALIKPMKNKNKAAVANVNQGTTEEDIPQMELTSSNTLASSSSSAASPSLYNHLQTMNEDKLVAAISRSGDPLEILRGPFIYVVVLFLVTIFCWRESIIGIVAISQLAAGDGMADIIGRRYGADNKWPFNPQKSIIGSAAFFISAVVVSLLLISWFNLFGLLPPNLSILEVLPRILLISGLCAFIELIPLTDDNITVPISASILSSYLLTHTGPLQWVNFFK